MAATEFRLFTFGDNPTEKGTFVVTKADAAACVAAWKARGTDLSLDYEHDVTREGFGPRPAAGWCALEVRADGLWAIDVRWTKTAQALLDAKEYRYFSPFFEHTEDGHVRNIINIALTNIPATHGIAPLVAASALARGRGVRRAAQPIPRGRIGLTRSTRTMNEEEKKAMKAALAEMEEKCKAMSAKLAESDAPPPPHDEPDGDEGDKKDATSAAAALCALTGERNPLAALAKLVERQAAGDDGAPSIAQRVALAVSEGKLPPVLKSVAETWTGEQLAAYLASVKGVPVKGPTGSSSAARQGSTGAATTLSAADREVAKRLGIPEDKFLASKNNLNARKGA